MLANTLYYENQGKGKIMSRNRTIENNGSFSAETKKAVKNQVVMGVCPNCVSEMASEYDHILPWEFGGSNSLENCGFFCSKCHNAKTRQQAKTDWENPVEVAAFVARWTKAARRQPRKSTVEKMLKIIRKQHLRTCQRRIALNQGKQGLADSLAKTRAKTRRSVSRIAGGKGYK